MSAAMIAAMESALRCMENEEYRYAERDLREALAAAPEQAEPVAWMYDFIHQGVTVKDWVSNSHSEAHSTKMGCHNIRPLSAAAHAPAAWAVKPPTSDAVIERIPLKMAQAHAAPYDQTELELCPDCGWKARTPDTCLMCEHQAAPAALAQQPLTKQVILECLHSTTNEPPNRLPPGWEKFARAIERAHGIGAQEQKP